MSRHMFTHRQTDECVNPSAFMESNRSGERPVAKRHIDGLRALRHVALPVLTAAGGQSFAISPLRLRVL